MQRKIAGIISTLFVPPSFTILIFTYLAFQLESDPGKILIIILTAFLFGFIFPIILFFVLRRKGKLSDNEALIKEERTLPFAIVTLFYAGGLMILIYANVHIVFIALWFCYISNTIIILVINKYWKISAHLMGAAGHAAALLIIQSIWFWGIILIIPFLGWARSYLRCHDFLQLAAGILLGFFSTYFQMLIITKYFYA